MDKTMHQIKKIFQKMDPEIEYTEDSFDGDKRTIKRVLNTLVNGGVINKENRDGKTIYTTRQRKLV